MKQYLQSLKTGEAGVTLERKVMDEAMYQERLENLLSTGKKRSDPPFNMTIYKGSSCLQVVDIMRVILQVTEVES